MRNLLDQINKVCGFKTICVKRRRDVDKRKCPKSVMHAKYAFGVPACRKVATENELVLSSICLIVREMLFFMLGYRCNFLIILFRL